MQIRTVQKEQTAPLAAGENSEGSLWTKRLLSKPPPKTKIQTPFPLFSRLKIKKKKRRKEAAGQTLSHASASRRQPQIPKWRLYSNSLSPPPREGASCHAVSALPIGAPGRRLLIGCSGACRSRGFWARSWPRREQLSSSSLLWRWSLETNGNARLAASRLVSAGRRALVDLRREAASGQAEASSRA